ncbi:MAG: transaldolase family protein, partial [Actinomycetota bacterium]
MTSAIALLAGFGQSAWYDNLTRAVANGGLDALVSEHGISGVTSNPTIFEKAIAGGHDYDEDLAAAARSGRDPEAVYWDLVCTDIGAAADRLIPIHRATHGRDGFVSVEVSPTLADDAAGTIAQAEELSARIARPNVMIKIPATPAGLPAIRAATAAGIPVNVTLIFSVERYRSVIDAYLGGLE